MHKFHLFSAYFKQEVAYVIKNKFIVTINRSS
jgi:hypothetical protein